MRGPDRQAEAAGGGAGGYPGDGAGGQMTLSPEKRNLEIQRFGALEELARSTKELLEAGKKVHEGKVRNKQAARDHLNSINESRNTMLDAARRLTELGDIGDVAKAVMALYPGFADLDLELPDDSGNDR